MQNLLLKKRFVKSKRKLTGRTARYFPIGITKNDALQMEALVIIKSEPMGGDEQVVEVSRVTDVDRSSKKIKSENKTITVFLKDLSPERAWQ